MPMTMKRSLGATHDSLSLGTSVEFPSTVGRVAGSAADFVATDSSRFPVKGSGPTRGKPLANAALLKRPIAAQSRTFGPMFRCQSYSISET